jgi:hypothetical protein
MSPNLSKNSRSDLSARKKERRKLATVYSEITIRIGGPKIGVKRLYSFLEFYW